MYHTGITGCGDAKIARRSFAFHFCVIMNPIFGSESLCSNPSDCVMNIEGSSRSSDWVVSGKNQWSAKDVVNEASSQKCLIFLALSRDGRGIRSPYAYKICIKLHTKSRLTWYAQSWFLLPAVMPPRVTYMPARCKQWALILSILAVALQPMISWTNRDYSWN